MSSHFKQQHYDPEVESRPPPKVPLSAVAWIPVSLAILAGIYFAARFGHERAMEELEARQNPTAANETMSAPFLFDPGDEPIVLAIEQKSLRDHLSAPPGSVGSGPLVESKPLRMRILARDLGLVRVMVVEGKLEGERYWTKADRLVDALRKEKAKLQ
jgi:hypothetical protein